MATEPKLVVALEARLNKFEKQLKEAGVIAEKAVQDVEKKFARANPTFGGAFKGGFLGGLLGSISVGTIERIATSIQEMTKNVADLADTSEKVGVTTDQLQELQFALEQSGAEAASAGPALVKFSNEIAKAAEGQGNLARFLQANNVALKNNNGELKGNAELLAEVANLIQNARTPQEQLNIATEFFGRKAGPDMVLALKNGSVGLQSFGAEAQRTGGVIDKALVQKAKEIDDKWNQLARTWSVTAKSAILNLMEAAERFAKNANVAAALDAGTESAEQLAYAIQLAKSKGIPIEQKWIDRLEQLLELQREFNKASAGFGGVNVQGTTLPGAENSGKPTNTAPLNTKAQADKDPLERAVESITKRIEVTKAETAVIDLGNAARERARVVAELETAAKQANTDAGLKNTEVTAEQRAKIDELASSFYKVAQAAEDARSPLREFARDALDTKNQVQSAAVSGLRSLEDNLVSVATGAKTAKEAFKDMANSIIQDMIRIAIRQAITGPLAAMMGGGGGAGGGLLSLFGGARAQGGPVSPGRSYLVGERGPELFMPKVPGQIIPKATTAGLKVTQVSYNTFSTGVTPTDMATISQLVDQKDAQNTQNTIQLIRKGQSNDSNFLGGGG